MGISESELEKVIEGHESRNAALRQTLVQRGVDFREPRTIECHFWTWSEKDAADLAQDLLRLGFKILVQRSAASSNDPSLWNVEAAIEQSIDLTMRREFTDELARAAANHYGRYDGWGTRL